MNYWSPKILEQLLEVQEIDLKIRSIRGQIIELYRRSKEEDPEIIRLKNELATCEEAVETTEAQQQMYLDTLEDIHTAIKGLATTKSGAFKPRTRSSTEALRIEEEKLAALHAETTEQIRQLNNQRAELQQRIKARSREVEAAQQGPEAEIRKLKSKLKRQDKQRESTATGIPLTLMKKYDRLRSSRSGIGLTVMRDGVCTICRMQMPTAVVSRLLNGGRVPVCPACGRMVTRVENSEEMLQTQATAAQPSEEIPTGNQEAPEGKKEKAKARAATSKAAKAKSKPGNKAAAKSNSKVKDTKKATSKASKKAPVKKATKKTPAAKKPAAKKPAAKKPAAKKPAAKKSADKNKAAQKPAAKNKAPQKPAPKKTTNKKSGDKKTAKKKSAGKK